MNLVSGLLAGGPHSGFLRLPGAHARPGFVVVCKTRLHGSALRFRQFAVDVSAERRGVKRRRRRAIVRSVVHGVFLTTLSGALFLEGSPPSSKRRCSRARDNRDMIVPIGTPSTDAAS